MGYRPRGRGREPRGASAAEALAGLEAACRERGLPVTVQRRAVLAALAPREDHPTADDLYESVRGSVPGLSRTTVYRVLDTLVALGLATRISHPGAGARFELRRERHHHLHCTRCGSVRDVSAPALDALHPPRAGLEGFAVEDWSVHFTGVCAQCRGTAARGRGKVEDVG